MLHDILKSIPLLWDLINRLHPKPTSFIYISEQTIFKCAEFSLAAFISRRVPKQMTTLLIEPLFFLAEPCMYLKFWNNAGIPFMLHSSLKPEGYLVKGRSLLIQYVIGSGKVVKRSPDANYDDKYLPQVKGG